MKRKLDFDTQQSRFEKKRKALGLSSIWSLFDMSASFRDVAFVGKYYVQYKSDTVVTSKALTNPTWEALYKAADALIKESGDNHHIYIEGFKVKAEFISPSLAGVIELYCGS